MNSLKDRMKIKIYYIFILLFLVSVSADAQCAMCRAVLESGEDQEVAKGINNGILYLMIIPYVLIGAVGYFIYKSKKTRPKT